MKVSLTKIKKLLKKAASKFVSSEEAKYFANVQVDNHIKKAPRTNGLKEAIDDLENWQKYKKRKFKIVADKKASMLIDFNLLAPSLKIKYIHDELEKRAKKFGLAMIGLKNSGGIHTLNLWTDSLAKRGLLSICMFNGGPYGVVPFGGTAGLFGTNPISYSIPTKTKPVIADFATSEIPFFEVRQAKEANTKLKDNVAVDSTGEVTTDPKKALLDNGHSNLLPMGACIKGYLINYLVEVMTGSLVNSPLSNEMTDDYIVEEHGGVILAFDISSFNRISKFKNSVESMNKVIRKQKPRKGIKKICIPGDGSFERAKKVLQKKTVSIDKELFERLEALQ